MYDLVRTGGIRFGVLKNVKMLVVNECQDLNWVRFGWLKTFIEQFNAYAMCVTDLDQSIFGSMNYFEPETARLTLTFNHRCTQRIQHAATTILAQQQCGTVWE